MISKTEENNRYIIKFILKSVFLITVIIIIVVISNIDLIAPQQLSSSSLALAVIKSTS